MLLMEGLCVVMRSIVISVEDCRLNGRFYVTVRKRGFHTKEPLAVFIAIEGI